MRRADAVQRPLGGIDAGGKPFEHVVVFDRIMRNCEVVRGVVLTRCARQRQDDPSSRTRSSWDTERSKESARAIIIERIARGEAPRPEPLDLPAKSSAAT